MNKVIQSPPPVTLHKERVPAPPSTIESTLAKILDRGVIRVGYESREIPFCYFNKWGELVGYDIAFAYQLAKDLDVKLELVPITYESLIDDVNSGYCDIVMTAIVMDETRILGLEFSSAYIEQPNAIVIPIKHLNRYQTLEELEQDPNVRFGAQGAYESVVKTHFPHQTFIQAGIHDLTLNKIDAYMWGELQAYIWCLAHPEYTTLTYQKKLGGKYFAYPMRKGSEQFVHFLNEWMFLKQEQGFAYQQRQYWFLGKLHNPEEKRWSFLRDVLHWVK